jgi:hypothetical protein
VPGQCLKQSNIVKTYLFNGKKRCCCHLTKSHKKEEQQKRCRCIYAESWIVLRASFWAITLTHQSQIDRKFAKVQAGQQLKSSQVSRRFFDASKQNDFERQLQKTPKSCVCVSSHLICFYVAKKRKNICTTLNDSRYSFIFIKYFNFFVVSVIVFTVMWKTPLKKL